MTEKTDVSTPGEAKIESGEYSQDPTRWTDGVDRTAGHMTPEARVKYEQDSLKKPVDDQQ